MSYVALQNITLSGTAASVTFGSIPNTFRDLILVVNGTTSGDFVARMWFNGDQSNISFVSMYGVSGNGSGISGAGTGTFIGNYSNGMRGTNIVQIMDYSATDKHKTSLVRSNNSADIVRVWATRWASNSAINSVTFAADNSTFASGSTFALYGIAG